MEDAAALAPALVDRSPLAPAGALGSKPQSASLLVVRRSAGVSGDGLGDEEMVVETPLLGHTTWVEAYHVVGVFVRVDAVRGYHVAVAGHEKRDIIPNHRVDIEYDCAIVLVPPAAANAKSRVLG